MKKIVALLLVAVLSLALAGCGNSAPAAADTPAPAEPAPSSAPAAPAESDSPAEPAEVTWPNGDVTIYVPASVGAPLDLATRVMADYLTEVTGSTFIVENDDVGGGYAASETVSGGTPDGSILMTTGSGQIVSYYNGTWDKNPANPEDFTLVGVSIQQMQPSGAVIVTQTDKPYDDWLEFVDYVNENPNTVTVGFVVGTPHEVRLKLLLNHFDIMDKVRFVSASNSDINTGLLGGNIDVGCLTETVGPQYITEGQLKGLIYSNYERTYKKTEATACLDDMMMVSDIVEDNPEALCCAWDIAYAGPAGMDPALAQKIADTMKGIADSPEWMERVYALGSTNNYVYVPLDELAEHLKLAESQIEQCFAE